MAKLITLTDKAGRVVGARDMRAAIESGEIRLIVRVVLRNNYDELLMQRRADDVITFPGYWDVSAAGHVDIGELPDEAAGRELSEELGITGINLSKKSEYYIESNDRGRILKQYTHVYVGEFDGRVDNLRVEASEVKAARWVSSKELENLAPVMAEAITAIKAIDAA